MRSKSLGLFSFLVLFLLAFSWNLSAQQSAYQRVHKTSKPDSQNMETTDLTVPDPKPKVSKQQNSPQGSTGEDETFICTGKKKCKPAQKNKLTVSPTEPLTFPDGLKECKVYDSRSFEKAILRAIWMGDCEWIVMRPPSDWDPQSPIWLQMDNPIVIADMHPKAVGHPLVITNDTGRAIVIKTPKNNGCAIIIQKPDVAIMGLTFEGAVCR